MTKIIAKDGIICKTDRQETSIDKKIDKKIDK